jgi:hypothetical protein
MLHYHERQQVADFETHQSILQTHDYCITNETMATSYLHPSPPLIHLSIIFSPFEGYFMTLQCLDCISLEIRVISER